MSSPSPLLLALGRPDAGWRFTLYIDAWEGAGAFASSQRRATSYVPPGLATDPDRSAAEAARRARTALRRYCSANRLNRLGTLTYAKACHDPEQIRADLREFFKRLRTLTGGDAFPYVWVPEWHKTDHGLHAHFALGRYVHYELIKEAWGHGHVGIKRLGNLPVGSGDLAEARRAAGYLSKYVAKSFEDLRRVGGSHRYGLAEGFQPVTVHFTGRSSGAVLAEASELLSMPPTTVWSSSQNEDWQGPPTVWAQWGR